MVSSASIVIDIGKTLSKVSLWSKGGQMLDRQVRPNEKCTLDSILRLDAKGIGRWLLEALARYSDAHVSRIVTVGHGAGVCALVDGETEKNALAFSPLDYEQALPHAVMTAYMSHRDPFAQTGSPALPDGLNIGSQLYWLDQIYPDEMAKATLVPWAQYWTWFLTGEAVSEVTSLGCHSDLWNPEASDFSRLAKCRGWADRFAPIRRAGEVVGLLKPGIAAATGLSPNVEVVAGLHDSNAALLAARSFSQIADNEATVLSTGTWFVAMRLPAEPVDTSTLPEGRDCLVNVDVHGRAVPSARFMGGREIETLIELDTRRIDITPDQPALLEAVPKVLENERIILPTLLRGFGPYAQAQFDWINRPDDWFERRAAACLYAALMINTSLDLIGTKDRLLVEGRFAEAEVFIRALASLRPNMAVYRANAHNDVSFGALRLIDPTLPPQDELVRIEPLDFDISAYRERWLSEIANAAERNAA